MGQRWRKIWQPLALGAAVVFLLGLIRWSGFERDRLSQAERWLREAIVPLSAKIEWTAAKTARFFNSFKSYNRLQAENVALKARIQELETRLVQLEEYRQENLRLREILRYQQDQAGKYSFLVAPLVGRSPSNWYSTIIIGRGSKDGLKKNQAVVTAQGLVGRIIATTDRTAEVLLLLDRESAVGGLAQESRVVGVVEGSPDHRGYLQMIHLAHNAPLSEGEIVITSGLGGIFPKGLPIGVVTEILLEPEGLTKRAIIRPAVDFERMEEVLVITGVKADAGPGFGTAWNSITGSGIKPLLSPESGGG
ncbi:MAG: rod shape-determining protein MreC [Clostridia bacterium]|nr:rod shape-determining protein MreC [Clostridia bacterium]